MHALPSSFIGRLRRRLAVAVWLFALVVSGQSILTGICLADGLGGSESATELVADTVDAPSLDAAASHETLCFHAGSGGCHCACAHVSGLPVMASVWCIDDSAGGALAGNRPAPYSSPPSDNFRPPIA